MKILIENLLIGKQSILKLDKEQVLYQENTPALYIFCLKKGNIMTYKQHERFGKLWLSFIQPGQILGVSALTKPLYEHSAIALEESEILSVPLSEVQRLIEEKPIFKLKLMHEICLEIKKTEQRGIEYYNKTVKQRIAFLLVELLNIQKTEQYTTQALPVFPEFITKFTGISSAKVGKTLQELEGLSMIKLDSHSIQITDSKALERVFRS